LKIKEVRALDGAELTKQLEAAHKELLDLRFQMVTKQLVNHRRLMQTRRKIAQMNTILREKALAAEVESSASSSEKAKAG
jgi:large subunit ribosomal protein L29